MRDRYISKVEKLCGAKRDYIVLLKHGLRVEAIERIMSNVDEVELDRGVMKRLRHKGKEIRVFSTGKLIVKDVSGEVELNEILEELLS
jgi:uncharacterized protein with ATP-grasp and redox domains